MKSIRWMTPCLLWLAALGACSGGNGGNAGGGGGAANLGMARAGLTQAEFDAFERGRLVFERDFRASEGLGPLYNATSCRSCHSGPVTGGSTPRYRNFYLAAIGVPGFQFAIPGMPSIVVPAFGDGPHALAQFSLELGREVIPPTFFGAPVTVTQRNAPPAFGVGLFETIADATIAALADPNDANADGISGRFNTDSGSIGRLGYKAQSNNIELFTRAPLQNQMGITSLPFQGAGGIVSLHREAATGLFQVSSDPNDPTIDNDGVADPEISTQDLGDLIAFTRFLAPPARRASTPASDRGEMLFDQVGCVLCHVPALQGSLGPVEAYTDLLIHDMGPALADGISMGVAQGAIGQTGETSNEFRTQPLWGVSMTAPFLHDGRADTLFDAIVAHAGEAESIKQAFLALTPAQQDDVIAFLEIL